VQCRGGTHRACSGQEAGVSARDQFSSIGGRVGGTPGMGAYQTAKFAVEGFSEVLSNELKPLGIKVTVIEPGAFRTDWGGSSMTTVPVSADYDQTVGEMNRYRESTVNTWPATRPAQRRSSLTSSVWRSRRLACCSARARSNPPGRRPRPVPPKPRSGPPSAEAPTSRPASNRPRQGGLPRMPGE
jgi:hypothetical protein